MQDNEENIFDILSQLEIGYRKAVKIIECNLLKNFIPNILYEYVYGPLTKLNLVDLWQKYNREVDFGMFSMKLAKFKNFRCTL